MKRALIFVLLLLAVIPAVLAINLNVVKTSSDEVMVADLNKPAEFNLNITNLGSATNIEFYNLLGFQMFPVGTTPLAAGERKEITLSVSPIGTLRERGHYTFGYFIRGSDNTEINQELAFEIIDLKEAFEVGSGSV